MFFVAIIQINLNAFEESLVIWKRVIWWIGVFLEF